MMSQKVSDTAARVVTAPTTLNQGLHLLKVLVLAFFLQEAVSRGLNVLLEL